MGPFAAIVKKELRSVTREKTIMIAIIIVLSLVTDLNSFLTMA